MKMKLERRNIILLSLISVVFLAGCTQAPTTPTGAGIIIKSFKPDISTVNGGDPVTFSLTVQNIGGEPGGGVPGGTDFNGVYGLLFGFTNEWQCATTTSTCSSGARLNGIMTPIATTGLKPADATANLPGETATITYDTTAPPGKGNDATDDASVRVFYGYRTESTTKLRFVTRTYVSTNPNAQKGVTSSTTSAGPLLVTATARAPVISQTDPKGRIQFEIQNIGSGHVLANFHNALNAIDPLSDLDKITSVRITATGYSDVTPSKLNCGGSSVITFEGANAIRLASGKSAIISCDIDVTGITNFQDIVINLNATYAYFVDSATQVTVLKALR